MPSEAFWAPSVMCISTCQCTEPLSVPPPHPERAFQKTLWLLPLNCFVQRMFLSMYKLQYLSSKLLSQRFLRVLFITYAFAQKLSAGIQTWYSDGLWHTFLVLKNNDKIRQCTVLLFSAFGVSGSRGENAQLERSSKLVISLHQHFASDTQEGRSLCRKHTLGGRSRDCYSGMERQMKWKARSGEGTVQSSDGHSWTGLHIGLYKQETRTTREPRNLLRFDVRFPTAPEFLRGIFWGLN